MDNAPPKAVDTAGVVAQVEADASVGLFCFGRVVGVHDSFVIVELFPDAAGFHAEFTTELLYSGDKGLKHA